MYMHPKAAKMQRMACMALRNTVVRNPELIDAVLGEGAESAINACLANHPKDCKDEAKAALRDLKCKVRATCGPVFRTSSLHIIASSSLLRMHFCYRNRV